MSTEPQQDRRFFSIGTSGHCPSYMVEKSRVWFIGNYRGRFLAKVKVGQLLAMVKKGFWCIGKPPDHLPPKMRRLSMRQLKASWREPRRIEKQLRRQYGSC